MLVKTHVTFESSWAALKEAVKVGAIRQILRSGDEIPVTLKTGEETVFVASYDAAGNLFFVIQNCLPDEHPMNKAWTNKGGWADCDMRRHVNETVFALLPDELQAVIAPTKVVQIIDGKRVETEDKLFLLSRTQVYGKGDWSRYEPEDAHLDIFAKERDRVKEYRDMGTWPYWLRSPLASSSTNFCGVFSNGYAFSSNASNANGVAFGFSL